MDAQPWRTCTIDPWNFDSSGVPQCENPSGSASSVTRHGRHRTSPALHVTRKTRSRRLAVAPLHHGAPRCDGCFTPRQTVRNLVHTGLNRPSPHTHSLHPLTHGISTRRTFHPAKTRSTP